MNKKITRISALVACIGILFLYVPGLATADTEAPGFDLKKLFKKPIFYLSSFINLFPFFNYSFQPPAPDTNNSIKPVKVTGGLVAPRPGLGD